MLETDYLIVGSGATGMAFADTLLSETDAQLVIVDRYAKPGGHWNVAYPFVTLHQPSQFYGVSSMELSNGLKDEVGLNKGLYDMASGAEVNAYFDAVMRHKLLPTGRVRYFPLCEYKGENRFESIITGEQYEVSVRKKTVDCTYLKTSVPATHTPNFTIGEGVSFMPLNDLPQVASPPHGFIVIGGGKTGIDACLWLLENQIPPEKITWIVSRDGWLINRENVQPAEEFFEQSMGAQASQMEAIAQASSIDNLFARLETAGVLLRLDTTVQPQMFHGATVSPLELEQLRRIKNVVRMGRVQSIEKDQILLAEGTIPTSVNHLHIDCSASAVGNFETRPIFEDGLITPQTVRAYQPIFSASLIAYVEANYPDNKTKNNICQIVPLPNHYTDWVPMTAAQMVNQITWSQDKTLRRWIRNNRLDGFGKLVSNVDRNDAAKMAIMKRLRDNAMPAMMKLQQFISELKAPKQESLDNPQLQVRRTTFFQSRLVDVPATEFELEVGEILVKINRFAYSANNITYAAAGDMIGYWQFFPPMGENPEGWGVIPVWGFAEVIASKTEAVPIGERLFGYFPPAKQLKMKPVRTTQVRFIDGAEHRIELPSGYNVYRRVHHEVGYDPELEREQMLLWPLYLTAFLIWDALKENDWYQAERILILSASSKTSIGVAYALNADADAPEVIGVTSARNLEMVQELGIYDDCITYDALEELDAGKPTTIVDMSGNTELMVRLHRHLGDHMKFTMRVGLTHWANARPREGIITERSELFFAPGQAQKRMKDWGPAVFDQKTATFLRETASKTAQWLTFQEVDGLEGLAAIHPAVCEGTIAPNKGLIVVL